MNKIGMVTIGQAPRNDVTPIVERILNGRAELIQAGALDGMDKEAVDRKLAPEAGDYVLTSRLQTGDSVVMSREKLQPLLQAKLNEMEEQGVRSIFLLCTGVFPGLSTQSAMLMEPDRILPPVVRAMVEGRRLGVIVPLVEQKDKLLSKFEAQGLAPVFAAASPYRHDPEAFRQAALELKGKVDVLLLDCMGYTEQSRRLAAEATGLPVILSNALMAKLISEMI